MKKLIYTLILLLLIFGCSSKNRESSISGHWCSCAKNGDYIEMHLNENKYKYSSNFGIATDWNEFKISGDTLIQYDQHIFEDSIVINKAKFNFTDEGELKLEYLSSDESWTLYRIDDFEGNTEDNSILRQETIERGKTQECVDSRTEEETHKDSLDRAIDFQF